jgi:putative protease
MNNNDIKIKKPELLAPASGMQEVIVAYKYGADAVYIGGEEFSLRAKATNFSNKEIDDAIKYAHLLNKKIYIAANIFAHNKDIDSCIEYFKLLNSLSPDGVIISDIGMISLAKEYMPKIPIHISTQANTTNYVSCKFWYDQGIKRVVVARELSLNEIKEIKSKLPNDFEIESFIHGAMCISYSGRCLLSAFFTHKSANLGSCTHPCRWKYTLETKNKDLLENYVLEESERPNEYFPVFENDRGTYIMNSKDLCMIEHIDDLIESGIDSFKIEGRMKTPLYVATITRVYRKAIDDYFNNKDSYFKNINYYKNEILKCTYREYTTGFYYNKPDETSQIYSNNTYVIGSIYYGMVEEIIDDYIVITQKNKFSVNDIIEIMKPNGDNILTKVIEILDYNTNVAQESCPHASQKLKVKLSILAEVNDILRSQSQKEQ